MLDISPVLSYHPRCYNDLCLQGRGSVTTFKQVISMTHQSASTVNETPGAAVQRTLRRAFFPTEELYFEVHRICLKNKCKINQEKTESAVVVDTTMKLSQDKEKHRFPYGNAMRCTLWRREGIGRAAHIYRPSASAIACGLTFSRSQPGS